MTDETRALISIVGQELPAQEDITIIQGLVYDPEQEQARHVQARTRELVQGWLAQTYNLSSSERTRQAYQNMLRDFEAYLSEQGLSLASEAYERIAQASRDFAARRTPPQTRKQVKRMSEPVRPATMNTRFSILSSFYTYALERDKLLPEHARVFMVNPIPGKRQRASVSSYGSSRAIEMSVLRERLAAINEASATGRRDKVLILLMLATGRRLAEIAAMRCQELHSDGTIITVQFPRLKGGKTTDDRLTAKLSARLLAYLREHYGSDFTPGRPGDERPVWLVLRTNARSRAGAIERGGQLSAQSIEALVKRRLGEEVHVHQLRHTFTRQMIEQGADLTFIQSKLRHSSLETTGIYAKELTRAENPYLEDMMSTFD